MISSAVHAQTATRRSCHTRSAPCGPFLDWRNTAHQFEMFIFAGRVVIPVPAFRSYRSKCGTSDLRCFEVGFHKDDGAHGVTLPTNYSTES